MPIALAAAVMPPEEEEKEAKPKEEASKEEGKEEGKKEVKVEAPKEKEAAKEEVRSNYMVELTADFNDLRAALAETEGKKEQYKAAVAKEEAEMAEVATVEVVRVAARAAVAMVAATAAEEMVAEEKAAGKLYCCHRRSALSSKSCRSTHSFFRRTYRA